MMVPYMRQRVSQDEEQLVLRCLRSGHTQGDGEFSKSCEAWLEEHLGVARALLTSSGTDALEMATLLLDLKPGDEVIMPSYTFVSTASAVVMRGAVPVFIDIRPDTLNLDETLLEQALSPRTRAIMVVHYAGVPCAMDEIMAFAAKHGLKVIEDAAHAVLSKYKGRCLGSIGDIGALSFHQSKNISAGEAGALLLKDPALLRRAEVIRDKGTNRRAFFRGEVDRYSWVDLGSSFLPADFVAALLYGQMTKAQSLNARRLELARRYQEALAPCAADGLVTLPSYPKTGEGNGHIYYLILPTPLRAEALRLQLKEQGVQAVSHYVPLHSAPYARTHCRTAGTMAVTERIAETLLRLPLYPDLTEAEQELVIQALRTALLSKAGSAKS